MLTGLIHCGTRRGRMEARPRDDHTKRYVCAGNRPGHQLAIVAKPVDELVAERVLELVTTASFRDALLGEAGDTGGRSLPNAAADLAAAQTRLQGL